MNVNSISLEAKQAMITVQSDVKLLLMNAYLQIGSCFWIACAWDCPGGIRHELVMHLQAMSVHVKECFEVALHWSYSKREVQVACLLMASNVDMQLYFLFFQQALLDCSCSTYCFLLHRPCMKTVMLEQLVIPPIQQHGNVWIICVVMCW